MRSSVRIRIALARRPWFVWAAVTLVCGGAALAMNAQVHSAGAERSSWGTTRGVLVATAPVAAGTPWREAAIVTRRLPVAALPTAALEHVDTGVVIVRDLVPGEVLVPADVGDGDRRFALVPAGHVIVAVARPEVLVPLTAGDRVEITTLDRDGLSSHTEATVLEVTTTQVLVAMGPVDALAVATRAADPATPVGIVLVRQG